MPDDTLETLRARVKEVEAKLSSNRERFEEYSLLVKSLIDHEFEQRIRAESAEFALDRERAETARLRDALTVAFENSDDAPRRREWGAILGLAPAYVDARIRLDRARRWLNDAGDRRDWDAIEEAEFEYHRCEKQLAALALRKDGEG